MSRESTNGFRLSDDDFDLVREAALRDFDVQIHSGLWVPVQAHHHDSAHGPGHLHFITITETGHYEIRTFNVNEWRVVQERTPKARLELLETRRLQALRIVNARLANSQQKAS